MKWIDVNKKLPEIKHTEGFDNMNLSDDVLVAHKTLMEGGYKLTVDQAQLVEYTTDIYQSVPNYNDKGQFIPKKEIKWKEGDKVFEIWENGGEYIHELDAKYWMPLPEPPKHPNNE